MAADENPNSLSDKWPWFLGVVFGGIATFSLRNLYNTLLVLAAGRDWPDFFSHIFIAACFYVFLAYDVGVYYFLVDKYPYLPDRNLRPSGLRFLLDLAMAFFLYVILITSTSLEPWNSTLIIAGALFSWHLGAILWHVLASWEHHGKLEDRAGIHAHALALIGYICVIFLWGALFIHPAEEYRKSFDFIWLLAAGVFAFSIWRTVRLARTLNERGSSETHSALG